MNVRHIPGRLLPLLGGHWPARSSVERLVGIVRWLLRRARAMVALLPLPAPGARHEAAVLTHSPLARRPAGRLSELLATLRLAVFVAALSVLIVAVAVGAGWIALHVLQHVVGPG